MNLAAISTVLILSLIIGVFFIIVSNLNYFSQSLTNELQIVVRLKKDISNKEIDYLKNKFLNNHKISGFKFISNEEALKILQKRLKNQINITSLKGNPLPDYFEIKLKNFKDMKETANTFKKLPGVGKVNYGEGVSEKIITLNWAVHLLGYFIIILLFTAALFVVSNTIRLTVWARRREIKIMQLVGAANWFIRWPFIIEGLLQGFIGSALAFILFNFSYPFFIKVIQNEIPFLPLINPSIILSKLAINLIFTGIIVGVLGSYFSINKFLHIH